MLRNCILRGNECIKMMKTCRSKAANEAKKFIPDGATILTHGHSRAVVEVVRVRLLTILETICKLFHSASKLRRKIKTSVCDKNDKWE